MGSDDPADERDGREREHDGDEDGAGTVGEALHGGAGALRLIDHAGDLRQHCCFAERLRTADDCAIVVERAGQDAAAGLALERRGFAGEHGFVDRGAAFDDGCVDGEALPGKDNDTVAGSHLVEGHDGLDAVDDAARSDGTQARKRVERGESAMFGAAFKTFAQEQKAENQQDRIEVNLAAGGGRDGGESGVEKGHCGAETRPACSCWWRRGAAREWR